MESWYDIYQKDGKSYLNDKEIKIIHQAGGGSHKLNFDMFNPDFVRYLNQIIGIK